MSSAGKSLVKANRHRTVQEDPRWATWFSRFGTLTAFMIAALAILIAPTSAIDYYNQPFPGFMVEQTLVVAGVSGTGWQGARVGLVYPMRVTHMDGKSIRTEAEFEHFIAGTRPGQKISVFTVMPDGKRNDFFGITLTHLPFSDLLRMFWLPYGIGLVYLGLGLLIYILRGDSGAGRAFTYFLVCAGVVSALLFNISTTHDGSAIWTFAIAQVGGSVAGLTVLFPREIPSLARRSWVRILSVGTSMILAFWGLFTLYDISHPWRYIVPWRYSYLYGALGLLIFIVGIALRLRTDLSPNARQQVRIILWGALIAFTPVGLWLGLQSFISIQFNALVFTPFLLFFPFTIAFAMLRYGFWDFKLAIRRTLIYSILTIILVGIYLLLVSVIGDQVNRMLGMGNIFSVIATVVIVLIYSPLRRLVQRLIDRRFARDYLRRERAFHAFEKKLRARVDLDQLSGELTEFVKENLQAESVSLWIPKDKKKR